MRHVTVGLLLLLLYPLGAFADFTGPVVSVLDGDTIEVLHNTSPERIRLSGIDCPEKGQVFGEAVNYTRTEWHQRPVIVNGKKPV